MQCGIERADITDDADDTILDGDKINALIAAGTIKKVPNIRVTINTPSEITADSFDPCEGDEAVNYDRSLTWEDANVNSDRIAFYNSINSASGGVPIGGVILEECDSGEYTVVFAKLKFSGGRNSPQQNTERQRFEFNVTYRGVGDDPNFAAPVTPID